MDTFTIKTYEKEMCSLLNVNSVWNSYLHSSSQAILYTLDCLFNKSSIQLFFYIMK